MDPNDIEDLYFQASKKLGRSLTDTEKTKLLNFYTMNLQKMEPPADIKRDLLVKAFVKTGGTLLVFGIICLVIWGAYMLLEPSRIFVRLPLIFILLLFISPLILLSLPYYHYVKLKDEYEKKALEKLDPLLNKNWKNEMDVS
ncbi:MAG: hypothetical protein V4545_07720 [Pseudomonadota bacterium]